MHVKQTTITGKSGIGVGAVYFIRDAILLACRRLDGVKTNVNQRRRNNSLSLIGNRTRTQTAYRIEFPS